MGLSASQARLLNLTARMHDIEYKAQNLEAQKLQMSNESTQVYKTYEDALNKQKLQFKQIETDGSATYKDASIQTLLAAGYGIKVLSGGNWYDYHNTATDGTYANSTSTWDTFENTPKTVTVPAGTFTSDTKAGTVGTYGSVTGRLAETVKAGATSFSYYAKKTPNTDEQTKLTGLDLTNTETLSNLVEAGYIIFEKPDSDGNLTETNVATDTSLQQVSNETDLKKAEAKYEADMRKIDAKDKKFDTDLAAMETERNAIKTEMETLKTVAKDNVDRTFKLFS